MHKLGVSCLLLSSTSTGFFPRPRGLEVAPLAAIPMCVQQKKTANAIDDSFGCANPERYPKQWWPALWARNIGFQFCPRGSNKLHWMTTRLTKAFAKPARRGLVATTSSFRELLSGAWLEAVQCGHTHKHGLESGALGKARGGKYMVITQFLTAMEK